MTSTWSAISSTSLRAWLDRSTVGEATYVSAQPPYARRVEAVRWLVQDERLRVAEHRGRNPQPLAHPEGEPSGPSVRVGSQSCLDQHAFGRVVRQPGRGRQNAQVVEPGTPGVVAGRLKDRADLPDRVWQVGVPLGAERRSSAARCYEPQQHPQRGRFAGAVGSEQGRDLAW